MKAILSSGKIGKWKRFLSFFGYVPIKVNKIHEDDTDILNLILPVPSCDYDKTVKTVKKKLNQFGIKQILFEKDMKKKYENNFAMDYHIIDGQDMMLTKLSESFIRIFKLYGIKKGKLRLGIAGQHIDRKLVEILRKNNEYLKYIVFQGRVTPANERIAEEFYNEYGINTLFKETLEQAEVDMILYTDGLLEGYGRDVKFIINLSRTPVRTRVPVLGDYHLLLPSSISKFNCKHVELSEAMEKDYTLKGFQWNT